jgi:apolipoprotein N-acyltransferase
VPSSSRAAPARGALAVAGGALLLLAFPPYDLWWLAPPASACQALAVRGSSARGGALLGLVAGLTCFVPLLSWSGVFVGWLPWLLLAVYQSLYLAAAGAALAVVQRLPWWPLWTACVWVLQEAVRSRWPFEGFTWGRLAFSQADAPTVGLAALAGAPAVTFAVALAGGLLAWVAVQLVARRARPAALAAAAVVAVLVTGWLVPAPDPAGPPVTAAVVQGNVPRMGLDFNAQREAVLRNHVAATEDLAAQVAAGEVLQPDLVVWPENSSDIDPFRNPSASALIDRAAAAIGVPILVGAVVVTDDDRNLENTSVVWDPVTGPGDTYVKRHPVPFAEYVPFRRLARLVSDKVDLVRRDFVAGDEVGLLQVGPAAVGVVICFEVAYDDLPRDAVRAGAQVLAVQTNNATFGFTAETEQQLAMARLRAVEHARTVLVASTSGVSAVIGPSGEVQQRVELFTQASPVTTFALANGRTPATRVGAWPEVLVALLGLVAVVVGARRPRPAASAASVPPETPAPAVQPTGPRVPG